MFGLSLTAIGIIAAIALIPLWLFVAMLFRVVVPTNAVHIVQSKGKTISYGKDQAAGNSYYRWPSWIPRLGVNVSTLPMSVFSISLHNYDAYDKGRLPFIIDIMGFFRINDSNMAAQRVANFDELKKQLEGILQGACRTILATNEIEHILEGRSQFGLQFTTEVDGNLKAWGVETVKSIELMDIRDANGSKVIANIMAKKSSEIDRESRVQVANNGQIAQTAEIEAKQTVALREQEAQQRVGQRTAQKEQEVGIAQQLALQAVREHERVTMGKTMEVKRVETVQQAEIDKEAQIVAADQNRETTIRKAEGQLRAAQLQAQGVEATGKATGAAETALLMAPVDAQIKLAEKIGSDKGYQTYLVSIRNVEAQQAVGIAQAEALKAAGIKIIATGGNATDGMKKVLDLISPGGGVQIGAMLDGLQTTDGGKGLADTLSKLLDRLGIKPVAADITSTGEDDKRRPR